jgi:glycosyltransferase involved in cell wall biosynthesis
MPPCIAEPALPVTVVVPAHDRAHLIERALASVARQRPRPPAEVIVVDDGSSDGTGEVAERQGVRVLRHERNRGVSAARNSGVAAASHPWIAFLDSDDEWLPEHLEVLWDLRGEHSLVAGSLVWLRDDGSAYRLIGPPPRLAGDLRTPAPLVFPENFLQPSAVMVRRDAFERAGGFDETMRLAEDLDLWVRLLDAGSACVTERVVSVYRGHPGQASVARAGLRDAHAAIVHRHTDREWCTPALLAGVSAVAEWDVLRERLAAGDRRGAVRSGIRLARPRRARALVHLWTRRKRLRARAGALKTGAELGE